jgi:hypothetical protein
VKQLEKNNIRIMDIKKILAKEFIILLIFLIITSIGYFIQVTLIKDDKNKSNSLYDYISYDYVENIFNSLDDDECYLVKQESVNSFRDSIMKSKDVSNDMRNDKYSKNYIKKLYYLICELDIKFDKSYSLKKFENKIRKYDYKFIIEKNKKIKEKAIIDSRISNTESFFENLFLFGFILVYPFRILFFLTKKCISILREK